MIHAPAMAPTIPDPATTPTMTVDEVHEFFPVSKNAIYEAIKRGEIPSIRIGRRILVPTAALRRMLEGDPSTAA